MLQVGDLATIPSTDKYPLAGGPVRVKIMRKVNGSTVAVRVTSNHHDRYRHGEWFNVPLKRLIPKEA